MNGRSVEGNKEIILEVSQKLFAEVGFSDVAISTIAREAKITKSLIYHYFKDKDEILSTLVDIFVRDMASFDKSQCKSKEQLNDQEHYALISLWLEFIAKRSSIVKILFIEALKNNRQSEALYSLMDRFLAVLGNKELYEKYESLKKIDEAHFMFFFFYFLPKISFYCFEEQWLNYAKVSNKTETMRQLALKLHYQIDNIVLDKVLGEIVAGYSGVYKE
jgi:AcrR family transcriptional regulator